MAGFALGDAIGCAPLFDLLRPTGVAAGADRLAAQVVRCLDVIGARLQGVELGAIAHVIDEISDIPPRRVIADADESHVHPTRGQRAEDLRESRLLPLQLHTQFLGDGFPEVDVETGQLVGRGILVADGGVVAHGRYDDFALAFHAVRQVLRSGRNSHGQHD